MLLPKNDISFEGTVGYLEIDEELGSSGLTEGPKRDTKVDSTESSPREDTNVSKVEKGALDPRAVVRNDI